MDTNEYLWMAMDANGCQWMVMDGYGRLWMAMDAYNNNNFILKRIGPRIVPCCNPREIEDKSERFPFTKHCWDLSNKYDLNHLIA